MKKAYTEIFIVFICTECGIYTRKNAKITCQNKWSDGERSSVCLVQQLLCRWRAVVLCAKWDVLRSWHCHLLFLLVTWTDWYGCSFLLIAMQKN